MYDVVQAEPRNVSRFVEQFEDCIIAGASVCEDGVDSPRFNGAKTEDMMELSLWEATVVVRDVGPE